MATQVKFTGAPNNEWCAVDSGTANVTSTLNPWNPGAPIGFETGMTWYSSQGINAFGSTGSAALIDTANDYVPFTLHNAGVTGNPTQNTQLTAKTATTVINTAQGQRLLWKNPC